MYYIEDNGKIILVHDELEKLTNTINKYKPEYKDKEILYTEKDIILTPQGEYRFIDDEEIIQKAKEDKYNEALQKAYLFQQEGTVEHKNCLFEMSDSNRKNLSDTEEALKLMGQESIVWSDKDDNLVTLTLEDIQYIRLNLILARIQKLWIEQYPSYKSQIEQATTVEDVNNIVIDYEREE